MSQPAAQVESVLDPTAARLAGAYAQAVLELLDDVPAEEFAASLDALVAMLDTVEGFEAMLVSSAMTNRSREALVDRLFDERLGEPLEGLLAVMARNGRLSLLRAAAESFRRQLATRQGKVEVQVITACGLDAATRDELEQMLRETLGSEPVLHSRVDPGVVGGVVVRVGDKVFDASVASELARLRRSLAGRVGRRGKGESGR